MPIQRIDATTVEQVCTGCGAVHAIPIQRASIKARPGPYALAPGDTLELLLDGTPVTLRFEADAMAASGMAQASAVIAAAGAQLAHATVDPDGDALRIVSRTEGLARSSIQVTGGTAQDKLGLDGRVHRPLCLGVTKGDDAAQRTAADTIDLPHCPACDAKECLVRTWDRCPSTHAQSYFAAHRRAVNALAQYLVTAGQALPEAQAMRVAGRAEPPDIDLRFPAEPLVLPPPPGIARREA